MNVYLAASTIRTVGKTLLDSRSGTSTIKHAGELRGPSDPNQTVSGLITIDWPP